MRWEIADAAGCLKFSVKADRQLNAEASWIWQGIRPQGEAKVKSPRVPVPVKQIVGVEYDMFVRDAALGDILISGNFVLQDAELLAQALAAATGSQVDVQSDGRIELRP